MQGSFRTVPSTALCCHQTTQVQTAISQASEPRRGTALGMLNAGCAASLMVIQHTSYDMLFLSSSCCTGWLPTLVHPIDASSFSGNTTTRTLMPPPVCCPTAVQVLALDVILANGTRRVFTNETDPFLMRVSCSGSLKLLCSLKQTYLHVIDGA